MFKPLFSAVTVLILSLSNAGFASEVESEAPSQILFKNVNIFNGTDDKLISGNDVLVEGNMIKAIGAGLAVATNAEVIDGGGKTLMPGLHDMHTHISILREISEVRNTIHPLAIGSIAAKRAEGMLMNGFTTIMDVGGPAAYLRPLIDEGLFYGPRIYSAEAMLSQTSGHGDFRSRNEPHPNLDGGVTNMYERYVTCIADTPGEITRCSRMSLRDGATHLKLMTSGGVSSVFDPLHSLQASPAEVKAAVAAAANWKTFVAVHAYTDESVKMSLDNGVKYIMHAPLLTEESAKLVKTKDAFVNVSLQAVLGLDPKVAKTMLADAPYKKFMSLYDAYPVAMKALVKYDTKLVYGTDLLAPWQKTLTYDKTAAVGLQQWVKFAPSIVALKAITSNAGLLALETGPNNPYPMGPTGVIKKGAYADLLIVDGNPLADVSILAKPDEKMKVIMKDGVIYKNTL